MNLKRGLDEMDAFGKYVSGTKVTEKPEILFARMDLKEVMEKVEAMHQAEQKALGESGQDEKAPKEEKPVIDLPAKEEITYDDFAKLQFQVGEIIACEEVKKSKKLLCSQVRMFLLSLS